MNQRLTMVAPARAARTDNSRLPHGHVLRDCTESDTPALAALYFAAYAPGIGCATLNAAIEDIVHTFDGGYGPLWQPGTLISEFGEGLSGAIMTVLAPDWAAPLACPFIIELFTAPSCRKLGIGRFLLEECLVAAHTDGHVQVALKVDHDNPNAQALYLSAGFTFV